jgi:hypothetical protein
MHGLGLCMRDPRYACMALELNSGLTRVWICMVRVVSRLVHVGLDLHAVEQIACIVMNQQPWRDGNQSRKRWLRTYSPQQYCSDYLGVTPAAAVCDYCASAEKENEIANKGSD